MLKGSKFMVHFKKIGALYEETASREELDKAFGKLKEASAKSLSDQERVLKQIQVCCNGFFEQNFK